MYINGQAVAPTNLIKEGHNYSTTEQVVGTWVDGKPIYEITMVAHNNILNTGGAEWISFGVLLDDTSILNAIDRVIDGQIYQADGSLPYRLQVAIVSNEWKWRCENYSSDNNNVSYCRLQYTKTTD
jgi:hypothetical protein